MRISSPLWVSKSVLPFVFLITVHHSSITTVSHIQILSQIQCIKFISAFFQYLSYFTCYFSFYFIIIILSLCSSRLRKWQNLLNGHYGLQVLEHLSLKCILHYCSIALLFLKQNLDHIILLKIFTYSWFTSPQQTGKKNQLLQMIIVKDTLSTFTLYAGHIQTLSVQLCVQVCSFVLYSYIQSGTHRYASEIL